MAEIDVAVFAFDDAGGCGWSTAPASACSAAPERACSAAARRSSGSRRVSSARPPRILDATLSGRLGPLGGAHAVPSGRAACPHQLLVLADVSRPLREEERQAWQRLIRVLGHELNNSLAPIQSIAGSLERLLDAAEPPPDWRRGHAARPRGDRLARRGAQPRSPTPTRELARLPPPRPAPVAVRPADRGASPSLETRLPVGVSPGPAATLSADADQLEQLLINLVRNAVGRGARDAAAACAWAGSATRGQLEIWVDDDGPGLPNTTNLFVPFFTTKPGGSGIGLVLSPPDRGGPRRHARRSRTAGATAAASRGCACPSPPHEIRRAPAARRARPLRRVPVDRGRRERGCLRQRR